MENSTHQQYFQMGELNEDYFDITHRSDRFIFINIREGQADLLIDGIAYPVAANKIYLLMPYAVYSIVKKTPELKGTSINFSVDFIRFEKSEYEVSLYNLFFFADQEPCILLDETQKVALKRIIYQILDEYETPSPRLLIIKWFMQILLFQLMDMKQVTINAPSINQKRIIDFFELLDQHFIKERNMDFYADKLHISTKRLNQILMSTQGKSAQYFHHWFLTLEAKRYLIMGIYSIKEIANLLGFQDRSYFSRFFKRYTSFSPNEFKTLFNEKMINVKSSKN